MLTATTPHSNLYMPLTHSRAGIETPRRGQKRPLSTVVFLCPLKSNTGLIRILSVMVGCIEQPVKRLAVPLSGSLNLMQPTAQELRLKAGGLYSNKGHKPMNTHTKNPLNISVSETPKPTITELALIEVSTAIGSIVESNAQFTSGFAGYLDSLNKNLSETTVFELIDLLNKYRADFNSPKKLPSKKTSRFNVLDKAKNTIATYVPFDVAMQHKERSTCTIKFCGMEVQS